MLNIFMCVVHVASQQLGQHLDKIHGGTKRLLLHDDDS
jgi:hypothetical protein